jgi:2-polyprenyl-3-methyl-5-hydroxy-6-metoxy-1,4-benzoquinol methylase
VRNESDKSYPELATLDEGSLDPNSSYSKMLELIGTTGRVLDVGCASGYLARLLTARGCRVTGIDVNAKSVESAQRYCDRALVADLDVVTLAQLFPDETFDVLVFGDVLEHLRNPWRVLDDARRLLAYQGYAVASIPNIAHGAIRLALLNGRFDYSEFGILDNTHLRFFTRRTTEELFVQAGYAIERIDKTYLALFAPTNLVPQLESADFDEATVAKVREDVDFETLQFVVKAKALDDDAKLESITQHYLSASARLETTHDADENTSEPNRRLIEKQRALEAALRVSQAENVRIGALLKTATDENKVNTETINQLSEERTHFRKLQQHEAELQLALADISNSIESSVQELESRIAMADDEVRHQRQSYDELCGQLSSMRHIFERAEEVRAFDLMVSRNNELVATLAELSKQSEGDRQVRDSRLWRATVLARRVLSRIRR